jgi:hypothetical protein
MQLLCYTNIHIFSALMQENKQTCFIYLLNNVLSNNDGHRDCI